MQGLIFPVELQTLPVPPLRSAPWSARQLRKAPCVVLAGAAVPSSHNFPYSNRLLTGWTLRSVTGAGCSLVS